MKKVFLMSAMMLMSLAAFAQAVISFDRKEHNFGTIEEAGGRVSTIFEFTNDGNEPLVLSNVRASCGCTTPTWTKTPIEPGQKGQITVTYNPNGRPGRFQKTITITSNATTPSVKLYIKGEVTPKTVKPVDKYPIKLGAIGLNKKEINFNTIMDDAATAIQSIEYANLSQEKITVALLGGEQPGLVGVATLLELEPNQTGQIQVKLHGGELNEYGSITRKLQLVVNGKTIDDPILVKAIVKENFSKMTSAQRQQAPILEIENKIDLGEVQVGGKLSKKVTIKNVGVNPLIIRKLTCKAASGLELRPAKSTIKGGKSNTIQMSVDTKSMKPASYTRQVELITNDPSRSRIYITVTWKVVE